MPTTTNHTPLTNAERKAIWAWAVKEMAKAVVSNDETGATFAHGIVAKMR